MWSRLRVDCLAVMGVNKIAISYTEELSLKMVHLRLHMLKTKYHSAQEIMLLPSFDLRNGCRNRLLHEWNIITVTMEFSMPSYSRNPVRTVVKLNPLVELMIRIRMLRLIKLSRPLCTWHGSKWFIRVYIEVLMALKTWLSGPLLWTMLHGYTTKSYSRNQASILWSF